MYHLIVFIGTYFMVQFFKVVKTTCLSSDPEGLSLSVLCKDKKSRLQKLKPVLSNEGFLLLKNNPDSTLGRQTYFNVKQIQSPSQDFFLLNISTACEFRQGSQHKNLKSKRHEVFACFSSVLNIHEVRISSSSFLWHLF